MTSATAIGRGEPTEDEAAAAVVAIELLLASAGTDAPRPDEPSRWRFSGRWWSKPLPSRRERP